MTLDDPLRCPLDGNLRREIAHDRYSVTYRCSWCKQVTVERVEPDVRNDINRSFDRGDDL